MTEIPPGGDPRFIEEMTLAVSGAAGSAAILCAKHGFSAQAAGGAGQDMMGKRVMQRLNQFGVDTSNMEQISDMPTSSSIVTTRPNGARPALHRKGVTGGLYVTDTRILHFGGVGLGPVDNRAAIRAG